MGILLAMRNKLVLLAVLSGCFASAFAMERDATSYVDPLIGTQKSARGYGGTMPFVTAPFGMTDWTAQTRQNKISVTSYNYDDTTISGFIGTHQPAIWMGDYGYVTLVPQIGNLRVRPEERKMPYRHSDEIASPDYYRVLLQAGSGKIISTELTASERCAMFRFRFPKGSAGRVIVEASRSGVVGSASVDPSAREITGFNPHRMDAHLGPLALPKFKGYFVVQFLQTPASLKTYGGERTAQHSSTGAFAEFGDSDSILVRVGTSFLSIEQARENLRHEMPDWGFDQVKTRLHEVWQKKLGRLQIDGADGQQRKMIYTAMYHAMLYPRQFSEYGRYYSAFDDRIHDGESYTAFSIWDTFRAENSLITLLPPSVSAAW